MPDTATREFGLGAFLADRVVLIVLLLCGYTAFLLAGLANGYWLIGANGHPAATDFMGVWAAGHLALGGAPAAAFDWPAIKAVQGTITDGNVEGYFSWQYPPSFLCLAAGLALLPYAAAFLVWMALSGAAYLAVMRRILPAPVPILCAAAFPAVLWNIAVGQTGMLTAALFGGGLFLLRERPILAGVLFGLLTYKPQFGILIPVALVCGGHWRTILAAGLTAIAMIALSAAVFGADTWLAFLRSLPVANQAMLVDGRVGLVKLQSVFGVVRVLGGSPELAWATQGILTAALVLAVGWLWRRPAEANLKSAALATAALLATPYVFIYDLVLLAVALAFLVRAGVTRQDSLALGLAALLTMAYPVVPVESGLAAVVVVAVVIAGRVVRPLSGAARAG